MKKVKVSLFKWKLLIEEFPFLAKIIGERTPDVVVIKKGDEDILSKTPYINSYSWSSGWSYDADTFVCVGGEGDLTYLVNSEDRSTGCEHDTPTKTVAPTVGEQIFEGGLHPRFLVRIIDESGDDLVDRYEVTVYKMGKVDLVDFFIKETEKAAAAIKAEISSAWGE